MIKKNQGMKPRTIAAIASSVVLLISGCSVLVWPGGRLGCWTSRPGMLGQVYFPDLIAEFVAECELSPQDTYMINLDSYITAKNPRLKTHNQVVRSLAAWREQYGQRRIFLLTNPSSTEPITYEEIRHVYLYAEWEGATAGILERREIWVDFVTGTALATTPPSSVLHGSTSEVETDLTADQRTRLFAVLADTRAWTQSDRDHIPPDWDEESPYSGWGLAICAGNYSVHRYERPGTNLGPWGLVEFMLAFQDILGTDVLSP